MYISCLSRYVKNDSPKGKVYTLNEQQIKMIFEKTGIGLFTNDLQNCYA